MRIKLRFFANIRETLGTSEEWLEIPETVKTVGDVRLFLMQRDGLWKTVLSDEKALRMACRFEIATAQTRLTEGCEVAFFPPVTGG